jgi:hypothetical protein
MNAPKFFSFKFFTLVIIRGHHFWKNSAINTRYYIHDVEYYSYDIFLDRYRYGFM